MSEEGEHKKQKGMKDVGGGTVRSFQKECFIDRDKPVSKAEGKREVRVTAEAVGRLPRAWVRALA